MDHISEPEDKLIRYGTEVIEEIRKENNMETEDRREEAFAILEEWLKTQDHLVKKDFSKGFLERCIITSKGSVERAKLQIDKMCTLRTLMPIYFRTVNIQESEIMTIFEKSYIYIVPTLTKEYHRVIIAKIKPNANAKTTDYTLFYKLLVVVAEYLKSNDYCRGFIMIGDVYDTSAADVLSKINLVELQQFIPVITEGYGTKIKGIIFLTSSKFIDGFIRIVKPLFSEKIASRIHACTSKKGVHQFISDDILPEEYGGLGPPAEVLQENLIKSLSSKSHQEIMKEMNKAVTDESKRQRDKFNEQYMGTPGSFRTLTLD